MKEHMKYIIEHAEEIEKLIKVKAQVSEVKSIMLENLDKVNDTLVHLEMFCIACLSNLYHMKFIIVILLFRSSVRG